MSDEQNPGFLLGSLDAKVTTLQAEMRQVRSDITGIRTRMDEQKGGWTVLIWLTSAAAAAGAMVTAIVEWVTRK